MEKIVTCHNVPKIIRHVPHIFSHKTLELRGVFSTVSATFLCSSGFIQFTEENSIFYPI